MTADLEREVAKLKMRIRHAETVLGDALFTKGDLETLTEMARKKLDDLARQLIPSSVPEKQAPKHLYKAWDEDGVSRAGARCGERKDGEPMTSDPAHVRCMKCIALHDADQGASRESARLDPLRAK